MTHGNQTIIVTCRGDAVIFGKKRDSADILAVEFHTPISKDKYLISIPSSVPAREVIQNSKVFAVNFLPFDEHISALLLKNVNNLLDKFMLTGFHSGECEHIDCPRIQEANAFFECEVIHEYDAGNHTVFVGKIVNRNG